MLYLLHYYYKTVDIRMVLGVYSVFARADDVTTMCNNSGTAEIPTSAKSILNDGIT